ncbi:MAG: DUF4224 domain-containing protein [Moraxellaceae bacterium]|nr:DUF4224 domain-containing protein [Moraxellaceae bacterium]
MSKEKLQEITGLQYGKAQARWFREYLGAEVPCDRQGPILTEQTYESLVARANGLANAPQPPPRPAIRPRQPR